MKRIERVNTQNSPTPTNKHSSSQPARTMARCSMVLMMGALVMVVLAVVRQSAAQPMPRREVVNPTFEGISQHFDPEGKHLSDEDSLEAMLLNYLYAKQVVERLRNSQDITDLQRKRSYWKQCAFNAVSCFGKK